MARSNRELELRVPHRTHGPLRAPRRSRAGFTVLEIAISAAILAVMMGLAGLAMMRSASAYQATTQRTMLEIRTRRALDRVVDELLMASAGSITTPLAADWASDQIEFQQVVDIAAGVVVLGPPVMIRFEYAPGEVPNGLDSDGNGLVDDGMLVMIRGFGTPNARRVILVRGVPELLEGETANNNDDNGNGLIDESGFTVTREGNTLVLRLSAQQPDGQGGVLTSTVETSISLRN